MVFFLQMSGFPGSGKSTLSRLIGQETKAVIIDHDVVKTAMLESLGDGVLDSRRVGGIAYDIEWALIDFHLSEAHSVILDSPCLYHRMLVKGAELTKKYNVDYKYIECVIDDLDELDRRLKTRRRMMSQIRQVPDQEDFKSALSRSQRPTDVKWIRVDTSQPIQDYIQEVMAYVNS